MFDEQEVIEFFNRIINAPNLNNQEIKLNVTKFYEYLALTKMCDEESLEKLSKIVACINEILTIKKTMGHIDINNLLVEPETPKKLTKKPKNQKHYGYYVSSSCGSSSVSSSSCGTTTYSSHC